jgi:tRNA(Ile)-lysidine synthase
MPAKPHRQPLAPPRPIVARVRRFIVDRQLVQPGDRVLAAVSGGADSTCLLLILAALRRSLKIEVHAAYFDHMLRGRRAIEREQRFLRTLCTQLDVPLHTGAADVREHKSKKRLSLEEAARDLRYEFLARTAHENDCATVATGHTEDDQAETVLLHIIRGSGLRGLAAMAPSAPLPVRLPDALRLIRPLLVLSRADTERCCRDAGSEPLEDATNRSRAHLRNRIRHDLLPLLRQYNPRIEQALVRLSSTAASDIETIEHLAIAALVDADTKNGALRISRRRLAELPEGLRAHAVRTAIERLLGNTRSFSERHIVAIVRAAGGATGTTLDLPRGLRVEIQRDVVILSVSPRQASSPKRRVRLPVPGNARFGQWSVRAELLDRPPTRLGPLNGVAAALLDADVLGADVWLRGRHPGDRYRPLGLGRSKKLQDILVDAHVPRSERDALPLLCAEGGIAWVAGQPPADWAKITEKTTRTVRVWAERAPA